MILRQLLHTTPAIGVSYVLGCTSQRAGVVVNRMLAIDDEEKFVDAMLQGIPPQPQNAAATRAANLGRSLAAV